MTFWTQNMNNFFFQAEDGIRDADVTGVQTCALPILSRDIEKRDDKRPVLSDLRESGSIEQDADIVMFLHRKPTKGDEDTTKQFRNKETELIIAKNRQGMTDSVSLIFHGHLSMFAPKTQNK